MILFRTALFCFIISVSCFTAQAQPVIVPRGAIGGAAIGSDIGKGLGQAASAIYEGRAQMASFNKQIADARFRYFSLLPDKPGLEKAGAEFYNLLREKDAGLLTEQLVMDIQKSMFGDAGNVATIAKLVGGEDRWDKGLAPVTREAFDVWMRASTAGLEKNPLAWLTNTPKLGEMFKGGAAEYERYRRIRDWNEYYNADKVSMFFGSPQSFVHFMIQFFDGEWRAGLSDEEVANIYGRLIEQYGETAVLSAAKKLMSARPSRLLTIRDPKLIDLPDWARSSSTGLMYLIAETANDDDFAVTYLVSHIPYVRVEDGVTRYEAMIAQHGAGAVKSAIASIRKVELEEDGRLTAGPHKGKTRHLALLAALPLNPDPVTAAWLAAKAEADRKYALAKAKQLASLKAQGLALAEGHLDAFIRARDLAERIDLHHMEKENSMLSRRPDALPMTEYRSFRNSIHAMIGLWNEFVETDNKLAGRMCAAYLQNFGRYSSAEMYKELRDLLAFTTSSARLSLEHLPSLAQVQSKRIADGRMSSGDALAMSYKARHEVIHQKIKRLQYKVSRIIGMKLNTIGFEAEIFEMRIALLEKQLDDPTLRPGQTEEELLGEDHLRGIVAAHELAVAGDKVLLAAVNKYRGVGEAKKLDHFTETELYIVAAAGLWDGYLIKKDDAYLEAAKQALSIAAQLDRTTEAESASMMAFITQRADPDAVVPVPPSVVQKTEIAAGRIKPEQAINFDTTPEVLVMLQELGGKRYALMKILRVSYGSRADDKARQLADVAKALDEIRSAEKKLDDYDKSRGNPSRFTK